MDTAVLMMRTVFLMTEVLSSEKRGSTEEFLVLIWPDDSGSISSSCTEPPGSLLGQ